MSLARLLCLAGLGAGASFLVLRLRRKTKVQHKATKPQTTRKDTLVPLLVDSMIPMEKIEEDYPAFTGIVRVMIGIVPRCDAYLEIWPHAFKTYNLIVPNLMNAPFSQVGVGPGWSKGSALQGLGMFVVSRVAECPYCTAHTCSYALRRGTTPEVLAQALAGSTTVGKLGEAEQAVIAVARRLRLLDNDTF
jgi:AhpD family alkylhydroperoxidase